MEVILSISFCIIYMPTIVAAGSRAISHNKQKNKNVKQDFTNNIIITSIKK